jgi:hypothetical protein
LVGRGLGDDELLCDQVHAVAEWGHEADVREPVIGEQAVVPNAVGCIAPKGAPTNRLAAGGWGCPQLTKAGTRPASSCSETSFSSRSYQAGSRNRIPASMNGSCLPPWRTYR